MAKTLNFPQISMPLDVIVVGGGINGAGIACEAASRGLKVGLYEAKDFAVATSSASSKLIHGGIRYLEHYEFRLVQEALAEREILLKKAAHIVKPMRFRIPHQQNLRPKWLIMAGLFFYDHLARRSVLRPSKAINLSDDDGLTSAHSIAFEYSDCWVDDSRLVIANVKHAHQHGAEVRNYCEVTSVAREGEFWRVNLYDHRLKMQVVRFSRALINATGPWTAKFLEQCCNETSQYQMQLIQGSHLIVPRIYEGEQAYILQNDDKRVVFVIPYLNQYSMIGTTDIPFSGDPYNAVASEDEISYLLSISNQHFKTQLTKQDIIDSFSGVRPLFGDPNIPAQKQSRDYHVAVNDDQGLPLISIYGGKLTTYRKLSQKTVDKLNPYFSQLRQTNSKKSVFNEAVGLHPVVLFRQLTSKYPSIAKATLERLIEQYGVEVWRILSQFEHGQSPIIADVYQCEIDHLVNHEWTLTEEDLLKRRTKLCYQLTADEKSILRQRLNSGA